MPGITLTKNPAQQRPHRRAQGILDVQWTGGYAPRFQAFFSALSFSRFDGESRLTHLPTNASRWAAALQCIVKTKGYK